MKKKTFVMNSYTNENFITDVPNVVSTYFNRNPEMNRTYQVNSGRHSSARVGTSGFNGATSSTTHLCEEDEPPKSNFSRYLGIGFLIGLVIVSITFLMFTIFYDEIIDNDEESAEEYWERITKEIQILQNKSKIELYNKTLQNSDKNFVSIVKESKTALKPSITFKNFINRELNPRRVNGKWISNNEILHYDLNYNLCITNATDLTQTVLITSETINQFRLSGLSLSADRKYFLTLFNPSPVYRYSVLAKYSIFSINESLLTPLVVGPEYPNDTYIQYGEWGPIGSQLVFIFRNDIYFKSNANSQSIRLTKSGKEFVVYNGIPDWVYEEEIICGPKTFWLSPNGHKLVFATINDTAVDLMTWPIYDTRLIDGSINQYTRIQAVRYPKPGRPNPSITLHYLSLTQIKSMISHNKSFEESVVHLLPPKEILDFGDHYFTTFKWIDNNWFVINWMNRAQNYSIMTYYSQKTNFIPIPLKSSNGWIDLFTPPLITPDKSSYIIRVPKMSDNKKEVYEHIARVSVLSSHSEFMTSGIFQVKNILNINPVLQRIYFTATFPSNPGTKHLMSVELNQSNVKSDPKCHTCLMNNYMADKQKICLTSEFTFSERADYYIMDCLGPNIPRSELRRTVDDSLVLTLESNEALAMRLKDLSLPKRLLMKVPLKSHDIDVMLIVPEDFKENSTKKYPLIFHVYGGPGSDSGSVSQSYFFNQFSAHLVSNKSVIYAVLDARGSANHGCKFMFDIYRKIGTVEVEDTIAVARYLRDEKSYIDGNSISLWGWSYGGYLTTMALEGDHDDPVFKCGIAVAPVADWMYYDSVYVERFMGFPTPDDNLINYLKSSTLRRVENLNGKQFLIMFGTADDNVHAMNSMMLLKAMNEKNIRYQTQIYPDNNHGLQNSLHHMYSRMIDFLDNNCFNAKTTRRP